MSWLTLITLVHSFLFIALYQIGHLEATQEADFLLGHLISYKDYFERDEGSYFLIWEMLNK